MKAGLVLEALETVEGFVFDATLLMQVVASSIALLPCGIGFLKKESLALCPLGPRMLVLRSESSLLTQLPLMADTRRWAPTRVV